MLAPQYAQQDRIAKGGEVEKINNKVIARWITVRMPRHSDFGGGTIDADLPDTDAHRAMYAGNIVREWSQSLELS